MWILIRHITFIPRIRFLLFKEINVNSLNKWSRSPIKTFKIFLTKYFYKYVDISNSRMRKKNQNICYLYNVWIEHKQSELIVLWSENRMKCVCMKKMKSGTSSCSLWIVYFYDLVFAEWIRFHVGILDSSLGELKFPFIMCQVYIGNVMHFDGCFVVIAC